MQIDASIASLRAALLEVTNDANIHIPPLFTDGQVLARPSFNYILALAKFFSQQNHSLGWKELLFPNDDVHDIIEYQSPSMTRKEQLAVLSRLLTVVSQITGRRFDVLVSPSRVLCGHDVLPTHDFLRALAMSTKAPEDAMAEAVKYVVEEGDANLYRRGVRTRKAFTRMQATCRGWLVRTKYHVRISEKETVDGSGKTVKDECYSTDKGRQCSEDACSSNISMDGTGMHRSEAAIASTCKPKSNLDEKVLLESYDDAMLSRKSKVDDELRIAEERVNRENGKLIRILNLGVLHKTKIHAAPSGGMMRPPLSAPSTGTRTWNNPLANGSNNTIDEAFVEKIANFSERQRGIKQKERRIGERESTLKQKFIKLNEKEAESKLQEERISKLGSSIQKQQMQLKEQKLQFERSKSLEPTVPAETSRPCLMCTEKNIQLRELRTKVCQRSRVLKQREAAVRRREIELFQREQMIADREQQSTTAANPSLHPEHNAEKQHQRQNENMEAMKQTPPDVSASTPPPLKEKIRKRSRRGPRKGSPTPIQVNNDQNSLRVSFGECIPTILEGAPAEEGEDDLDEQISTKGMDDAGRDHITRNDIHKVRQNLGIAKLKRKEAQYSSDGTPSNTNQQDDNTREKTKVSTPELDQKKRHVFSFEKNAAQNSHLPLEPKSETPIGVDRARAPSVQRDQKPRQHDDWISSFDVQMKCAVNRLRELA